MPILRSRLREHLLALGWFQFQNLLATAFRKKGYDIETPPRLGPTEGGIDLILHQNGGRIAVQCNHAAAWRAGGRLLRRFIQARTAARIPSGILASAAGFTDEVHERARAFNTIPWDVPEIVRFLEDVRVTEDPALTVWLLDRRRMCPHCGVDVTSSLQRSASPARVPCLSCPAFPNCAYTLGIWAENERNRALHPPSMSLNPSAPLPLHAGQAAPAASMEMIICPVDAAHSQSRFEPTHLVSLQDPGTDVSGLRPPWISPENHYVGLFCDIRDASNPDAPQLSQIRSVIDWLSPRCLPGNEHRFLIHCEAGLGRSPAVGYVAWALHLGPGREQEAWELMTASCVRNTICPNTLIIRHADSLLGRQGLLCDPARRWSVSGPWSRWL